MDPCGDAEGQLSTGDSEIAPASSRSCFTQAGKQGDICFPLIISLNMTVPVLTLQ